MLSSTGPGCFFRTLYLDLTEYGPFPGHQPTLLLGEVVVHLGWGTVCFTSLSILFTLGLNYKCGNARDAHKQYGLVAAWCPNGYLQALVTVETPAILAG